MNRMTESLVNWSGFYVPSLANDEIANEIAVELESHKGVRKVECDRFLSQVAILHDADQISRGQLHRLLSRLDSDTQLWSKRSNEKSGEPRLNWTLVAPSAVGLVFFIVGAGLHLSTNLGRANFADWFDGAVPSHVQTCYLIAAMTAGVIILREGVLRFTAGKLSMFHLAWILIPALFVTGHPFESAMLATCISICVWMLDRTLRRCRAALYFQAPRFPSSCRSLASKNSHSIERETICLEPDNLVEVWPGEQIPADGIVLAGASAINMQHLTGNASAINTGVGDKVYAGAINLEKILQVQVQRRRFDSVLPNCLRTLHRAASDKIGLQVRSQQLAGLVLSILVIACGVVMIVGPLLPGQTWDQWLYRGLVLLSLACPFAILIRSSTVVARAISQAAANGFIIGSALHLDQLNRLNVVAFEKGGCVTYPNLKVERVSLLAGDIDVKELMSLALSVEVGVDHPISDAIVSYAREHQIQPRTCTDLNARPGIGVEGVVDGDKIWVGNLRIPREHGILHSDQQALIAAIAEEGYTPVLIGRGPEVVGVIGVSNPVRAGIDDSVRQLKRLGITHSILLSGDHSVVTDQLADQLGFDRSTTELLAEDKVGLLQLVQRDFGAAIAVGDGIIDGLVLQEAAIGIAMNVRSQDAVSNAEIAVLHDDATKVAGLLGLAKQVQASLSRGNLLAVFSKLGVATLAIVGIGFVWLAILVETILVCMAAYSVSKVEFSAPAA